MAHHVGRRHHATVLEVVGYVEQARDEDAVARHAFGGDLVTAAAQRQATRQEAALGADRDDHRVLHLLGLDQAEHLGAEVFLAVRPAQAAAGDVAKAQVHALDPGRIDEDLELRHRLGQLGDQLGVELEAEVRLVLAVGVRLVEVGAQCGLDQVQVAPQDAVLVEHLDIVQGGEDRLLQALLLVVEVFVGELARQVEAGLEQPGQLAGDIGVVVQGAGDVAQVEAQADLLEVTGVGTQQRDVAPWQAGGQHQAVERVVLGVALDDMDKGVLEGVVELLDVEVEAFAVGESEVVDPELAAAGVAQAVRELTEHAQAEVFQDRQHVRQCQRRIGVVELAVQRALTELRQRLVEAHGQRLGLGQVEHMLHVDHRRMRGEALAVAGREAFREVGEDVGAVGFAEVFHHQRREVVLPRTAGLDHFVLQLLRIDLDAVLRVDPQDQLHAGQHRLGEEGPELAVGSLQALHQHLLDLLPHLGGVDLARHVGQAVAEAAVRVLAQEHADLVAFLDLHDRHGGAEQLVHRGLEQVVAGQHFQDLGQFLAQVRLRVEMRAALDFGDLAADVGDGVHALAVHRRGVQAHEAAFLDHLAVLVDLADRHVVRVGRAVHAAWLRSLGERQQARFAQVGDGVVLDAQVIGAQACAQQAGQAQERGVVVDQVAAVGVGLDGELLVAEEGEMVVQKPRQEALHLGLVVLRGAEGVLLHQVQQLADLGFHRLEVGDHAAHLGQHLLQLHGQGVELGGVGAAVDLQVHQRFMADALAQGALGQQLDQLALGAAAHAEHGGLQGVDAVAAAVELGAHRVDQEWQVVVQHLDHGVRGLPAVAFVIGVVDPHLRVRGVEALDDAPGGQRAAGQVRQPALSEFVQRDDAEELFSEQCHLWQGLFVDVLRQGRLQLMLEVGFAGCGEERHLWYSAWALL